ncbi:MAG: gliding motility protein RemB [Christiangramia sp.]|uniref:gliding motility protein RemB n=1 Tax=Christiangramia sp. TaxID=1931228 RepID=UPI0032427254
MKHFLLLLFLISGLSLSAQETTNFSEIYPKFPECETAAYESQQQCFDQTLVNLVVSAFQVPEKVASEDYHGTLTVIFEVTEEGAFELIYQDAAYEELKEEMKRVFGQLPVIEPATYNGRPIHMQFKMPIQIPLSRNSVVDPVEKEDEIRLKEPDSSEEEVVKNPVSDIRDTGLDEYDQIRSGEFTSPRYKSSINIPLSHEFYGRFDAAFNQIGLNTHSASKPFLFNEVNKYYDFQDELGKLQRSTATLAGRKLWNEHLIRFQTDDYWFTIDAGFDLEIGKDFEDEEFDFTYNNTRAAIIQGGLGKNLNFYTVVYENQGRFAGYYNRYAESISPAGGDPAIVPGRGIAKEFMNDGYDYPVAEGYLSFSPGDFINIQFGHGKNFIGDGYRSLLLSENASPYPFFKLNTTFWKLKYTNTWMSLRDVRGDVVNSGSYRTKYIANHYLSWNATKRLNIGFFESVMWENDNGRGFDINYLNPVIFYRAIEFSTGADGGNAIIGLTGKYKFTDQLYAYGQWVIDEFSSVDVFGGEGSWKNKLGFQLGLKYSNAFDVPNLFLQAEYNQVRPYTFSHNSIVLNYGHNNQSMAHQWGANFREYIAIARYRKDRWYGDAKLIIGKRGFDFVDEGSNTNYGQNIYRTEEERALETGVKIGQGNTTNSIFGSLEAGYIVNPTTNLKLFGRLIYRDFNTLQNTVSHFDNSTVWLNFGVRTDIFNWYFDY